MVMQRLFAIALSIISLTAQAQTQAPTAGTPSPSVNEILSISAHAKDHPEEVAGSGWQQDAEAKLKAQLEEHGEEIKAIADDGQAVVKQALAKASKEYGIPALGDKAKTETSKAKYRMYVSQSMGVEGLKQAMLIGAAHKDLVICFRGMKPGQTLRAMFDELSKIMRSIAPNEGDALPQMEVNPPVFSDAKVAEAPTLEKLDDDGHRVAWVRGIIDPAWLDGQVADQKRGDLGARGETYPVVEEDMLEKMQHAAKTFDYDAWAKKAQDQYWKSQPFVSLPTATTARERLIDPTVEVKDDILTPDGKYIAHKGDRFNPLETLGFHQTVVIFNGTDPNQVDFVKSFVAEHAESKLTLVTTEVDREQGWDGFGLLQQKIGRAVYLMNDLLENTFQIEHVPSLVTARELAFVVTEVPVHHGEVVNAVANTQAR